MKHLYLQYCKIISFYNIESLWFPNTKGIKAVEGGRKRMTIKLMITRQDHSRSVGKRTVFILWSSNHAKKKITYLNQERCWRFGDGFCGVWGGKHGKEDSSTSSERCHWRFHNRQNLLTACHAEMLLVSVRASLSASPPKSMPWNPCWSTSLRHHHEHFTVSSYLHCWCCPEVHANPAACFSSETALDYWH